MSFCGFIFAAVCLVVSVLNADCQYVVPNVEFQALQPMGLRVSIPDSPGIKLFGFHGKVNENTGPKDTGTINGDVLQAKNGRWVFEDLNVRLAPGDNINYWVFVQQDIYGYRKDKQIYTVTQLVAPGTPWKTPGGQTSPGTTGGTNPRPGCETSATVINNGKATCKGATVFEENFGKLDPNKWLVEQRLPDDKQEYEFVSYQIRNVKVAANKLVISPTLQHILYDKDFITGGILDLTAGCTAMSESLCMHEALGADIVPPVISGRVSTKNAFSFKYGRIEIRAKLPQGDWIYPELYLEPARSRYGVTGYDSGVIRVAFARGNLNLEGGGERFDNAVLSGGILVDRFEPCRSKGIVKNANMEAPWGNAFHTYGLTWTADGITLSVDGQEYGRVVPPDGGYKNYKNECPSMATEVSRWVSKMAPFDQEFYITLGLGVGGIADFPDNVGNKKWKNKGTKSKSNFWKDNDVWYESWRNQEARDLIVDSVKVWAL